jgi:uncharacterized protein (DUF486 family)
MPAIFSPYLSPVLLLIGSNVFMTAAWYWHLRYKEIPLFKVILFSWALALVEYCLAVPANRYGNAVYSAASSRPCKKSLPCWCSRLSRSSISRSRCIGTMASASR